MSGVSHESEEPLEEWEQLDGVVPIPPASMKGWQQVIGVNLGLLLIFALATGALITETQRVEREEITVVSHEKGERR